MERHKEITRFPDRREEDGARKTAPNPSLTWPRVAKRLTNSIERWSLNIKFSQWVSEKESEEWQISQISSQSVEGL